MAKAPKDLTRKEQQLVKGSDVPSSPPHVRVRQAIAEATQKGVTPSNYVPLGTPLAGLHLLNWHRAATMMQRLIMQTGIARRLHAAIRNYVLGEGIERGAKAKDPKVQPYIESIKKIIEDFWEDPRNDLDRQLHDWIHDSSAYGDLCLPVICDETDGTVVLQNLPALWISEVKVSDLDVASVTQISTSQGTWKDSKRRRDGGYMDWAPNKRWLDVIRYDAYRYKQTAEGKDMVVEDEEGRHGVLNPHYGELHGQCFYFRINRTLGAVRGWGDSFSVMDLMQALDQFIFDSMNRLDLQSAVVWDLEVDGNDDDVKKWQDQPIITGSKFFAHNKKIKLTPLAPAVKIEEFVAFIRIVRELIAGSVGIPEFAMGYGGDTNVATAKEQAPVMYAEFNNRRTLWESWLKFMLRFVIEQKNKAKMIYDDEGKSKVLSKAELDLIELQVNFKPFDRSDVDKMSDALGKLADALLALESGDYISHDMAQEVAMNSLAQFGVNTEKASEETQGLIESGHVDDGKGDSGKPLDHSAIKTALAEAAKRPKIARNGSRAKTAKPRLSRVQ